MGISKSDSLPLSEGGSMNVSKAFSLPLRGRWNLDMSKAFSLPLRGRWNLDMSKAFSLSLSASGNMKILKDISLPLRGRVRVGVVYRSRNEINLLKYEQLTRHIHSGDVFAARRTGGVIHTKIDLLPCRFFIHDRQFRC